MGVETVAFVLLMDRLMALRDSYRDTYGDRITIMKNDPLRYKSLSEEDVWFSHVEILDEHTLSLSFLVAPFDMPASQGNIVEEEEKPWYGTRKYDIVDRVLRLQEEKDKLAQRSAV